VFFKELKAIAITGMCTGKTQLYSLLKVILKNQYVSKSDKRMLLSSDEHEKGERISNGREC
jgi:hypothetical protein